ncbi:MAG: hypothetical protein JNM78_16125 [Cyclobacteriaceae bacterium]|nr:hypothetical protein [Cyclobacteriaceae bacterium]
MSNGHTYHTTERMLAKSEFYKGIEFIRISTLPANQKEIILVSLSPDKVIKILKDDVLLSDCVLYSDYLAWFNARHQVPLVINRKQPQVTGLDISMAKN